ncbi:MAG: FAD:protein FMN transferase [bacterium]
MIRLPYKIFFTSLTIILQSIFCQRWVPDKPDTYELFFLAMGSSAHVLIYPNEGVDGDIILKKVSEEIKNIENIANRFNSGSEISKINSLKIGEEMSISNEMIILLTISIELTDATNGAFDPTYLTYLEYKNSLIDNKQLEDNWSKLSINRDTMTVKKLGDVKIDLSAIAKGYAADMALISVKDKIKFGMVEIGGDISIYGEKPDGLPWVIILPDEFCGYKLNIRGGCGIATSSSRHANLKDGDYHIINPITKNPCVGDINTLVIGKTATCADAYATALIVMGKEGLGLINKEYNLYAMVSINGNIYKSNGIDEYLKMGLWTFFF